MPTITSLPYSYTIDASALTAEQHLTGGATAQIAASGAFDGSDAYQFTTPTTYQGYSGLASSGFSTITPTKLYVRFLIKFASGFTAAQITENKMNIIHCNPNDNDGRNILKFPGYDGVVFDWNIDEDGGAISGTDSDFRSANDIWFCIEHWSDTDNDTAGYTITKQDGTSTSKSAAFPQSASAKTSISYYGVLGGFWGPSGGGSGSAMTFYMSHITVDDSPVGVPSGFLATTPTGGAKSMRLRIR